MRCLACNVELTDEEASKKYDNWEEIKNPEHRYIDLCNRCISKSELNSYDDDMIDVADVPEDDGFPDFDGDCV